MIGSKIRYAFTLLELLVVIGIVAILAAIIFPVFTRAKTEAFKATTLSNLRQCGQAIVIYSADYDDRLPVGDGAYAALAKAPTCDAKDYWNPECKMPTRAPLVGSYAYYGLIEQDETELNSYLIENGGPVLAAIWYGKHRVAQFDGMQPPRINQCIRERTCLLPNVIIFGYIDTSAKRKPFVSEVKDRNNGNLTYVKPMTWPNVFHYALNQ